MAVPSTQQTPPPQAPPQAPPYQPMQPQPMQYAPMAPPQKERTAMPLAGGILLLVVGILGLIVAIWVMASASMLEDLLGGMDFGLAEVAAVMGIIGVIFSLVVILGGYFATQRTHFGLAIVGGVFSLLVGLFVFLFGAVLGLIGLILIAVSHKEFQ